MYVIRECRGRAMSRCTSQLTSPIKSPITSSLSVDRAWVRQTRYASDSSSTCATGILIYDASCGSQCCWPMRQAVHHLGLGGDLPCQYSSPPFSARAPLIWVQYVVRSWSIYQTIALFCGGSGQSSCWYWTTFTFLPVQYLFWGDGCLHCPHFPTPSVVRSYAFCVK